MMVGASRARTGPSGSRWRGNRRVTVGPIHSPLTVLATDIARDGFAVGSSETCGR